MSKNRDLDQIQERQCYLDSLGRVVDNVTGSTLKDGQSGNTIGAPQERKLRTIVRELGVECIKLTLALPDHVSEVLKDNEQWQNSRLKRFGNKIVDIYEPIARAADRVGDVFSGIDPGDRILMDAKRRSEKHGESTIIYPF